MRTMFHLMLTAAVFAGQAVFADTCADPDGDPDERAALLEDLKISPNPAIGRSAANAVWSYWMRAPDAKAQAMLDDGMRMRESYAFADAEIILDALITYCPTYAEGWNQRAFVRFLREDFAGSLEDIEQTLVLEPAHFGALSGKALALFQLGQESLGTLAIRRALTINPWMSERALIDQADEKDI